MVGGTLLCLRVLSLLRFKLRRLALSLDLTLKRSLVFCNHLLIPELCCRLFP